MLVRFTYLAVSHAFAALRLSRMTDREKDVEILALRHQLTILHRQFGDQRPRLWPEGRALLAVPLVPLARVTLRRLRLLVSPDTMLRWHRDLVRRRHARASKRRRPGCPHTVASNRRLVLRLATENPSYGTHFGSTSGTTTSTEPTDHSPPQHPYEPDPDPLSPTGSNASPYAGGTVSAESSMSINMPLELRGCSFRHAQGSTAQLPGHNGSNGRGRQRN